MKKINLLRQLMIVFFLSSAVCFAQNGSVLSVKLNKLNKKAQSTVYKHIKGAEVSPNRDGSTSSNVISKATWDITFSYDVGGVQEAGVETDGNFIYTSDWAAAMFYKYSMTGTLLDSFSIASVSGIRDLAFDGTYFYGGANSTTIYKMDFTSKTLVGTIACPTGTTVRNIAYDPILNGFWVGGWDTDITCVNSAGAVVGTITAANHALTGIYGSAYDGWSQGGPYLWLFDQGTNGDAAIFNQISLTTFLPTGVTHACTDISATALAGGAFCSLYNGKAILGGTAQGEKIFAYELADQAAHCDIAPVMIVAPLNSDLLTASTILTVEVANHDTVAHHHIPVSYIIDGGAVINDTITDTIPGGSSKDFSFIQPCDFSTPGHVYDVMVYTAYACDTINTNDTLHASIYNDYDASSISIDMNPIIAAGSIDPLATVQNVGTMAVTFDVTMKIDTYTSTKTVTSLAPGATQQVTFDSWNAALGSYTIEVYTQLSNDMDLTNDTLEQAISVQDLTKAYCFVAYDPTSTLPAGPAYTYLEDPGTIISLADQSSENFIAAGAWGAGNKWYGAVSTDNTLVTIDTITGARTVIGTIGKEISGLAFDYTSNTLYGVDWNSTNSTSNLYRINTANGSASLVGTSSTDLLINLACDTLGNLYSLGITNDSLYSINKITGLADGIGLIGFDASYAQDMEFNYYTNELYLAGYNATTSAGDLSLVNTVTGLATSIGAFAGGSEITSFAIPYNFNEDIIDAGVAAIVSPSNDTSCVLSSAEIITVNIANFGNDTLSNFDVSYKINSGTPVTETVAGPLLPFGTLTHTFAGTEDLSAFGSYVISAYTTVPGDINNTNDTVVKTVISADATITINIQTDNYGSETTWELINNNTSEIVATGGPYANVTGGEMISTSVCVLSSDCFTFNIYDSYGDGNCCSYGNGSYEIVWGTTSLGVIPGSFTSSATVTNICAPLATDAGVIAITAPTSACSLSATEDVIVTIQNFGTDPISNFQVSYEINSGSPVNATVTQTINSGATLDYTFTGAQAANLAASGVYTITAYTTATGDTYSFNDTTVVTISTGASTVPYTMGFEPTENVAGWTFEDTNNDTYMWSVTATGGNTAPSCIMYPYNSAAAADDWAITNCITFETGKTYHISYWYKVYSASYAESFDVMIGNAPVSGSLTTQIASHPGLVNTTYEQGGADFTVSSTGNYYIGFHCNSAANMWNLYLDDINIYDATGIEESANNAIINVYPNPAKDMLNINSSNTIVNVMLTNAFGQTVYNYSMNGTSTTISTANLANGIYYIQIETAEGITMKKISVIK